MRLKMLLLAVVLGIVGCEFNPMSITQTVVQGYILWKEGEAAKYYHREPEAVTKACRDAVIKLGFVIEKDGPSPLGDGHVMTVQSQNHKFGIRIREADPGITVCKIRVDFMGDKPYAELIFRTMDEPLGHRTVGVKVFSRGEYR